MGHGGISSFYKQLQIRHLTGYSKAELCGYRCVIWSNTIDVMQILLYYATDDLPSMPPPSLLPLVDKWSILSSLETTFDDQLVKEFDTLWHSDFLQNALTTCDGLPCNAAYFAENVKRFALADYVPNAQDILHCRSRITGVKELEFDVNCTHFRLVHVGGSRSMRNKWFSLFGNVDCLLYFVDLSSYHQTLYYDDNITNMQATRRQVDSYINNKWFSHVPIHFVFGKCDVFERDLKKHKLQQSFNTYRGDHSYDDALAFVAHKFCKLNRRRGRSVTWSAVNGLDNQSVQMAFEKAADAAAK